ncbi:MAG: hypothetical protein MK226_02025 [Saprospiraceae bacterium]|nr:hypothetical protein [Saprospiraceae bacterium]
MKQKLLLNALILLASIFSVQNAVAQGQDIVKDSTGLLGDNFCLEGALTLFKQASSLEAFEEALNREGNNINNLDLNEDGEIDYVRVVDNMEGNLHAIALQVPFSKSESQDIAVIAIEKTGDEQAVLQIIGDETLYGEDYFVEPFDEGASGGNGGPSADLEFRRVVVNVWLWPSVRFIYRPGYRVWVSPFGWGVYPRWWRPWRPRPWRVFYPRTVVYRPRYHVVRTPRVVRAHRVYTPRRTTSRVVVAKSTTRVRTTARGTTVTKTSTPRRTTVTKTSTTVGKKNNGTVGARKKTTTVSKTNRGKTTTTRKRTTTTKAKKKGNTVTRSRTKTTKTRKRKKN